MHIFNEIYFKISNLLDNPFFLKNFFDNRFYLILLVIILVRLKYGTYSSMWLSAIINIPGTILHELMHFIVGLALNAKPVNFTVLPKKDSYGNYVMGSVGFTNMTFYNAIPSAMAPLLLLPIGFYVNRYALPVMEPSIGNYILYVLLQTIIIENSIPSSADFKVSRLYFSGVILYSTLLIALLLML